jgi:hypothetical protein
MVGQEAVSIDTAIVMAGDGALILSASVPLIRADSLLHDSLFACHFAARQFPIAAFESVLSPFSLQNGYVSGTGTFAGGRLRIAASGALRVDSLIMSLDDIDPLLGPLVGEAVLSGDSLVVKKLAGPWGGGRVSAAGTVVARVQGGPTVDMRMSVQNVALQHGEDIDARIDTAAFAFRSLATSAGLSGTVDLGESYFTSSMELGSGVEAGHPAGQGGAAPPSLNVIVRLKKNLYASTFFGRGIGKSSLSAKAQLDGILSATGTTDAPLVAGEFNTVDGTVTYLDRVFTIQRGRIRQVDQYGAAPSIDLLATVPIARSQRDSVHSGGDTIVVSLGIQGTINNPQITFSAPNLTQAEIASLLTFGSSSLKLSQANGMLQQRASAILQQQFFGYASAGAEKLLGLEDVSMGGNVYDAKDRVGPTVTASKSFGKRVRLTYTGRIGDREEQKAVVSWKLLPVLYLDGEASADGTTGIDAKVKVSK